MFDVVGYIIIQAPFILFELYIFDAFMDIEYYYQKLGVF